MSFQGTVLNNLAVYVISGNYVLNNLAVYVVSGNYVLNYLAARPKLQNFVSQALVQVSMARLSGSCCAGKAIG